MNKMNIYVEEYLGRKIKVLNSSDKTKIGIEGFVLNETKKTFQIKTNEEIKTIPKVGCIFEIHTDRKYLIDGDKIILRPEERLKLGKKLGCNNG